MVRAWRADRVARDGRGPCTRPWTRSAAARWRARRGRAGRACGRRCAGASRRSWATGRGGGRSRGWWRRCAAISATRRSAGVSASAPAPAGRRGRPPASSSSARAALAEGGGAAGVGGVVRVAEDRARGAPLAGGAPAGAPSSVRQRASSSRAWLAAKCVRASSSNAIARSRGATSARIRAAWPSARAACPSRPRASRRPRLPRPLRRRGRPARALRPAEGCHGGSTRSRNQAALRSTSGGEILDRAGGVVLGEPQAAAAAERRRSEGGPWGSRRACRPTPRSLLGLVEATLLGAAPSRATESRAGGRSRRRPRWRAALELAAGEVAALVGDLRLLPVAPRRSGRATPVASASARSTSIARSASSSASALISIAVAPEGDAADREPAGVVTVKTLSQHLPRGRTGGLRRILADRSRAHGRGHQPLARRSPGRLLRLRPRSSEVACSSRPFSDAGDERELDQQLEPHLALASSPSAARTPCGALRRRRRCDRSGRAAASQVARRVDAQGGVGRATTQAPEDVHSPSSSPASSSARPRSNSTAIDDLGRGRLGQCALEQLRRGRQSAESSRRLGGAAQRRNHVRRHRAAVRASGARRRAGRRHLRRRAARPRGRAARRHPFARDPLARRGRDERVGEGIRVGVEHPLGAQLLLGCDRLDRVQPGERAGPARLGVAAQHRDGVRECSRGRRRVARAGRPTSRTSCGGAPPSRPSLMGPMPRSRVRCSSSERYSGLPRVSSARASDRPPPTPPGRATSSTSRAVPAADSGAGSSRTNARSAASIAMRVHPAPPAGRRRRARAAARPRAAPPVRSRRKVSSSAHCASSRNSASGSIVGQLDDQPPQRVHDLVAARARPARIRQRAIQRAAPPSDAGPSGATSRAARASSARAAANGTRASLSSAVAYRTRAPAAWPRGRAPSPSSRVLPIPASPSISTAPPRPADRGVDNFAEHRELGLSLDQHVHRPIVLATRPPRNASPSTYRDRYRAPDRRGPTSRTIDAWRHPTERSPNDRPPRRTQPRLPTDLDPDYVARHRRWIASQPGFCGGYHLLESETGRALSLTHVGRQRRARRCRP